MLTGLLPFVPSCKGKAVITRLAKGSGINPDDLHMDPNSIESIRHALSTATDEDLRRVAEQYEANQKRRG